MPEPKPFVVETRPPATEQYPDIGYTPPPRAEPPMSQAASQKLDEDLQSAGGIRKKRKPVPPPAQ